MMENVLITFNAGSSTIKLGVFAMEGRAPRPIGRGSVDLRAVPPVLRVEGDHGDAELPLHARPGEDQRELVEEALHWVERHFRVRRLAGAGHRVVHGGDHFAGPALISDDTLAAMEALSPLAPLHQPESLRLIRALRGLRPGLPQVASFDTAFHRTQDDTVRHFALPRALFAEGVKRYGFHGLSYQSIAAQLRQAHPRLAEGRVVVAHLGSGASLCGMEGGASRDTSMSFSTLDGIPMATRPGALDPGVLLYLLKEKSMTADALEDLLYHRSGLLGISGISGDARELAAADAPAAKEALAVLALRTAREIAAIATTLGGLDGIVFTAGVGEHQPAIRAAICRHLEWLGAHIDPVCNAGHGPRIHAASGKLALLVLHTDEEQVIADEACHLIPTPHQESPT